ncbi:MAG: antitoxin family protein [Gemmatimonadetes bacterium]|nr:antitoxin family protein [Gemmatimonadota bacterium]
MNMQNGVRAVVHDGRIEPLDKLDLPEGTRLLLTVVRDEDDEFWTDASQPSLEAVWNNGDDDVYGQLL